MVANLNATVALMCLRQRLLPAKKLPDASSHTKMAEGLAPGAANGDQCPVHQAIGLIAMALLLL